MTHQTLQKTVALAASAPRTHTTPALLAALEQVVDRIDKTSGEPKFTAQEHEFLATLINSAHEPHAPDTITSIVPAGEEYPGVFLSVQTVDDMSQKPGFEKKVGELVNKMRVS